MAADNAGLGNFKRLRQYAVTHGFNSNDWFGNVEVGVAAIAVANMVECISNIYKYQRMVGLRAEMDRPFVARVPISFLPLPRASSITAEQYSPK